MELDLTASLDLLRRHETEVRHFVALLATANTRARLTGPTDEGILWEDHVVDCAAALALLPQGGQVIDVGTGGGLPGLVWALCRPDLGVTLLDSVERKCALVGEMVQVLGLPPERVQVVCERSETFAARNREVFDLASARAVCEAGILAEVLSPLVRPGGHLLAFKGPRAEEELEGGRGKWDHLGLGEPDRLGYDLGDKIRCFVRWEKTGPCPSKFPRRPGAAEKRPWYR